MNENLSKQSTDALKEKVQELKRSLLDLRMNASAMHVKDYSQFRKLRKDVARVLTELSTRKKAERNES